MGAGRGKMENLATWAWVNVSCYATPTLLTSVSNPQASIRPSQRATPTYQSPRASHRPPPPAKKPSLLGGDAPMVPTDVGLNPTIVTHTLVTIVPVVGNRNMKEKNHSIINQEHYADAIVDWIISLPTPSWSGRRRVSVDPSNDRWMIPRTEDWNHGLSSSCKRMVFTVR